MLLLSQKLTTLFKTFQCQAHRLGCHQSLPNLFHTFRPAVSEYSDQAYKDPTSAKSNLTDLLPSGSADPQACRTESSCRCTGCNCPTPAACPVPSCNSGCVPIFDDNLVCRACGKEGETAERGLQTLKTKDTFPFWQYHIREILCLPPARPDRVSNSNCHDRSLLLTSLSSLYIESPI